MHSRQLKQKRCAVCEEWFIPARPLAVVCGLVCARKKVKADKAKGKAELRARKAALKTIPDLLKEAQREFNSAIRERDRVAGHSCISCGRNLDWSGNRTDCGHFRSVGSAGHLRFNENNAHAQCKHCNQWRSGNAVDYRIGLIQRIGLEAVEALEADNNIRKWTREELIAIRDTYRQKLKELRSKQE